MGLFALQFAKAAGAEVIITSKDDAKLSRATALGADHGIDYSRDPDWGRTARRLFSDTGADVVIELGGGATLNQSLRAVRRGGTVSRVKFSGLPKQIAGGQVLFEYVQDPPPPPIQPGHQVFRDVDVSGGTFSDWLAPHDARVYRFDL